MFSVAADINSRRAALWNRLSRKPSRSSSPKPPANSPLPPNRGDKTEETNMSQALGRYIVADPEICHGKPTFRGTRILVNDVLDQVASGMAWEVIIEEWRGSLNREAIAE